MKTDTSDILGLKLHQISAGELQDFMDESLQTARKAVILYLNIHGVCLALEHQKMSHLINRAEIVFCDGNGIGWGLKILGQPVPDKIAVTRWIWKLAEFSAQKNHRLYLLGSKPGVAEETAKCLQAANPKLQIAGTHHGYFNRKGPENEQVLEDIRRTKPDIVIVGFGMPIQEEWIDENESRLNVPILMTGGAVFDYVSGKRGKVPGWMIRLHLEWLFRIYEEPKRLFWRYMREIPFFFSLIFLEKMKQVFTSRQSQTKPRE
ncbi:MAG: WecB/TagA/CpsF family glycosyltransferase [Candidatus Omnitrophica bacterium]|nr:WecB/TagA/CpsF family glycosyltransferase [Candidatus Omnitrophota bacterium]